MSKNLKEENSSLRVEEFELSDKISSIKLVFSLKRNFVSRRPESRVVLKNGMEIEGENFGSNSAKILVVQVNNLNNSSTLSHSIVLRII